jgi:7-cyano-7-deazaguanine synthase
VPRAICLLSGGLDSSTALAWARREGYACFTLAFDYGQRHLRELESAAAVSRALGAEEHEVARVDLRRFGGSALTADLDVPLTGVDTAIIPVTYVPARNTIFLSLALAYAEVREADAILLGINALDYSGYPDCRPEYLEAMQRVAELGTKQGVEGHAPRLLAPLVRLSKAEIVRLGTELGVPWALTWSCYQGGTRACGLCDSCRLRLKGFEQAGLRDPLPYAGVECRVSGVEPAPADLSPLSSLRSNEARSFGGDKRSPDTLAHPEPVEGHPTPDTRSDPVC